MDSDPRLVGDLRTVNYELRTVLANQLYDGRGESTRSEREMVQMEAVVARSAPIVWAGSFEGTYPIFRGKAQAWNWSTGELLTECKTVFDGTNRQAVSPSGESYVAANWRKGKRGGVGCYDVKTGERVWHRTDLRQVQGVRFSADGEKVWCRVDDSPVHCLEARSGSLLAKLKGVDDVAESQYTDLQLHSRRRADYLLVGAATRAIPRITFAMSDAAFSSNSLCVAEYNGPVRCIDCASGKELWRYVPPQGFHVIKVSYQSDGCFYGLLFGYEVPENALIRFSPDCGECTELCRFSALRRCGGVSYGSGGFGDGVFVTGAGFVVSLVDGTVQRRLAFPVKDESCPRDPVDQGLGKNGRSMEQVEWWQKRESKAGHAAGMDDFYRANRMCVPCSGLGKVVLGVRWCDEDGIDQSEVGPVESLIERHGLEAPKNWLSDSLRWDYLYETCSACEGRGHFWGGGRRPELGARQ